MLLAGDLTGQTQVLQTAAVRHSLLPCHNAPLPTCCSLTHPPCHPPSPADVPVIFASLGSGHSAALLNTVIIGAVNVVATFVSIASGELVPCTCDAGMPAGMHRAEQPQAATPRASLHSASVSRLHYPSHPVQSTSLAGASCSWRAASR